VLTSRRALSCIFCLAALLLSACERPATQSSWSPIDQAWAAETQTALPPTLGLTPTPVLTAIPIATATAMSQVTLQPLAPIDFGALPAELPASLKGYELYSWPNGADWNFTLITGTDRTKSMDEIMAPASSVSDGGYVKLSVGSVSDLERLLARLPAGSSILWGGIDLGGEVPSDMVYLTFPPQSMMDEVAAYCSGHQLTLTSLKSQ